MTDPLSDLEVASLLRVDVSRVDGNEERELTPTVTRAQRHCVDVQVQFRRGARVEEGSCRLPLSEQAPRRDGDGASAGLALRRLAEDAGEAADVERSLDEQWRMRLRPAIEALVKEFGLALITRGAVFTEGDVTEACKLSHVVSVLEE